MLQFWKAWRERKRSKAAETVETFVVAIALALLIRTEAAEAFYIPSESMVPTLLVGDRLVVEKVTRHFELPNRGDIVVFYPPPAAHPITNDAWIKRVIALPGDKVDIRGGKVYLNGKALVEPYIESAPMYPDPDWASIGMPGGVVPKGDVFVMGDNRNNSDDGHVWGPLPVKNIIGRSVFRFWPLNRIGIEEH